MASKNFLRKQEFFFVFKVDIVGGVVLSKEDGKREP